MSLLGLNSEAQSRQVAAGNIVLLPVLLRYPPAAILCLISFAGCGNHLQIKTKSFSLMKILLLSPKAAKFRLGNVEGRCFGISET